MYDPWLAVRITRMLQLLDERYVCRVQFIEEMVYYLAMNGDAIAVAFTSLDRGPEEITSVIWEFMFMHLGRRANGR